MIKIVALTVYGYKDSPLASKSLKLHSEFSRIGVDAESMVVNWVDSESINNQGENVLFLQVRLSIPLGEDTEELGSIEEIERVIREAFNPPTYRRLRIEKIDFSAF